MDFEQILTRMSAVIQRNSLLMTAAVIAGFSPEINFPGAGFVSGGESDSEEDELDCLFRFLCL